MEIKHRTQLVELLNHFKLPLIAAEIGVAEGYNSADLLQAGIDKLYMIDIWESIQQNGDANSPQSWHDKNFKEAMIRVAPFGCKSIVLKGFSYNMAKEVPDNSLGLIYIDGDHSYEGVKKDLNAWFDKVITGGIISGHDFLNDAYGVKKATEEFCMNKFYIHIIPENSPENASFWFRKINKI